MYSERYEAAARGGVNAGIAVAASWLVSVGDAVAIGNAAALGQVLGAQARVDRAEEELEDVELAGAGLLRDLSAWKDMYALAEGSSSGLSTSTHPERLEGSSSGLGSNGECSITNPSEGFELSSLRGEWALRRKAAKKVSS